MSFPNANYQDASYKIKNNTEIYGQQEVFGNISSNSKPNNARIEELNQNAEFSTSLANSQKAIKTRSVFKNLGHSIFKHFNKNKTSKNKTVSIPQNAILEDMANNPGMKLCMAKNFATKTIQAALKGETDQTKLYAQHANDTYLSVMNSGNSKQNEEAYALANFAYAADKIAQSFNEKNSNAAQNLLDLAAKALQNIQKMFPDLSQMPDSLKGIVPSFKNFAPKLFQGVLAGNKTENNALIKSSANTLLELNNFIRAGQDESAKKTVGIYYNIASTVSTLKDINSGNIEGEAGQLSSIGLVIDSFKNMEADINQLGKSEKKALKIPFSQVKEKIFLPEVQKRINTFSANVSSNQLDLAKMQFQDLVAVIKDPSMQKDLGSKSIKSFKNAALKLIKNNLQSNSENADLIETRKMLKGLNTDIIGKLNGNNFLNEQEMSQLSQLQRKANEFELSIFQQMLQQLPDPSNFSLKNEDGTLDRKRLQSFIGLMDNPLIKNFLNTNMSSSEKSVDGVPEKIQQFSQGFQNLFEATKGQCEAIINKCSTKEDAQTWIAAFNKMNEVMGDIKNTNIKIDYSNYSNDFYAFQDDLMAAKKVFKSKGYFESSANEAKTTVDE